MFNKKSYISILFLLSFTLINVGFAKEDSNQKSVKKTNGSPAITRLNINNVSAFLNNDGKTDHSNLDNSGFEFPKGSSKQAVYISGLIWGCKVAGRADKQVGGSAYRQGLQPGKILANGTAQPTTDASVRIYRVRPDYKTASFSTEMREEGLSQSAVYAQYEKDWNEWPATDGAPYLDKNKNGKYDPTVDIPGFPGADQTVWYVANDLNIGNTQNMYGADPLGIEMQLTAWAYAQSGALGNMQFKKFTIINKGTKSLDSMYVAMWSDPDVGDGYDDLAGCDTALSLGFVYNGKPVDATYGDIPPPAVGWDFFQGPIVKTNNTADKAIFKGQYKVGYKNLPMAAYFYFINGSSTLTDPTQASLAGSNQFYNFMQGKIGKTGQYFVDPKTGKKTTYALAGDPLTGKGWLDSQPDDRRIGLSSGPFTMAVGDTQEVVVAQIAAGAIQGVDRLGAVGLLKFYDKIAQQVYNNFFQVAPPPPAPKVSVSELDRKVVLSWGDDLTAVSKTENSDTLGYKFQGYNVYQLPDRSATLDNPNVKRLATFDIIDGVLKIKDDDFNYNSGEVLLTVKQFGSDNGIKRYLEVNSDALNGNKALNNYSKYYFAVTAYSYNPNVLVANNLESTISPLEVMPQSTKMGVRNSSIHGDTVKVQHKTVGGQTPSEGLVTPIVIDPNKTTGHTYKVTFDTLKGNIVWNLFDSTANKQLLKNQSNQSGDDTYSTVDGMIVKVTGPSKTGMKDWAIPAGERRWTWSGAAALGLEGFDGGTGNGAIGNAYDHWFNGSSVTPDKLPNVLIKFAKVDSVRTGNFNWNQPNASKAARFMRNAQNAAANPAFAPYMVAGKANYDFIDFKYYVPLAAYNAETGKRLQVGFFENNVATGKVDGKYWPNVATGAAYAAATDPREWFFIFDSPYDSTALASNIKVNLNNPATPSPMLYLVTAQRRNANAWTGNDQFMIYSNHINQPKDYFVFNSPKQTYDVAVAKTDMNLINVFPNPYYGANPQETNKYQRFVKITHLPAKCKISVFNVAGYQVKEINKDDNLQYSQWDLANESGVPVGSGIYILNIDIPGQGTKILKVAVIQEQQILDRF